MTPALLHEQEYIIETGGVFHTNDLEARHDYTTNLETEVLCKFYVEFEDDSV